jgi:Protein of unknown function (DUF3237)
MSPLTSRFLATLHMRVADSYHLHETPAGRRRIDIVGSGTIEGQRLRGIVLPGASDALLSRNDGVFQQDVRLTIRTHDDALIYVTYRGVRHGPEEVMARLARDETADPTTYYLRNVPVFETGAAQYSWLNRIIAVGVGRREPKGVIYDIHEIL